MVKINPFAFRPAQISFWTTATYLALLIPLIVINESVPPVKYDESRFLDRGLNLTEAWLDLDNITQWFHHQNSRQNDVVRNYLLLRIEEILASNGVQVGGKSDKATIFNDLEANVTFLQYGGPVHYQGSNVYVYIRGRDDVEGEWWHDARPGKLVGKGGVLVNAHFDSVATAYGATDDGMGVATVLQLIRYFTTPGNQPARGVVALLNNAEEPGLLGAVAFGKSPVLPFVHTFLNLEGAGAGGRCMLFRTTDQEVTSAYANVQSPFGSVVGSDGFRIGLVKSGTDYSVWHDVYGQRGLDLAFYRPRALYHTRDDDVRHASRESLWQMMADSVTTVINLSADTGDVYVGERPDGAADKVPNGSPSDGVWFDLFGSSFVVFNLRGMFAWSLTLLIVSPLAVFGLVYLVHRKGRGYLFSSKVRVDGVGGFEEGETVHLGGLKGLFRFPFALVVSGSLVVGSALLLKKVNPFIIYSSDYAVWAMMFSLSYFSLWTIMRGAAYTRPSALHRVYVHFWLFFLGWVALVYVTVLEDRMRIASGYMFVFWQSQVFLSTVVAICELFSLPRKDDFAREAREEGQIAEALPRSDDLIAPSPGERADSGAGAGAGAGVGNGADTDEDDDDDDEAPTEETPLFRKVSRGKIRTSFAAGYRRSVSAIMEASSRSKDASRRRGSDYSPSAPSSSRQEQPYGREQPWSAGMLTWTWLVQFLLLAPFQIILVAQIGLMATSAVDQTGVDGSNLLIPYFVVAVSSLVLVVPLSPFVHRASRHVPLFLLAVAATTLVYNLAAFPFSPAAPYKAWFKQTVDLDTGATAVQLTGLEEYVRVIIGDLPSAAGLPVVCEATGPNRPGLVDCVFDGARVPPSPAHGCGNESLVLPPGVPPTPDYYAKLVSVRAERLGGSSARLTVDAVNTRAVELRFPEGPAVRSVKVVGGDPWDERFGPFPDGGARLVRLWRRDWDREWVVELTWDPSSSSSSSSSSSGETTALGLDGFAVALWSDANDAAHSMPAFREVVNYAPPWATITKISPGLVEGSKAFKV